MKYKIAMLVFSHYPEDERVKRETDALIGANISIDIICLRRDLERIKDTVDGAVVYRIPINRKRGSRLRYLWEYLSFSLISFIFVTTLFIKKRYSLIHVHNMPDFLVFCCLIPKLFGTKIVLDLHDPSPEVYMTKYSIPKSHILIKFLMYIEKYSIRFSDHVITPNKSFVQLFISRGCPAYKITTVMNAPDEKVFLSDKKRIHSYIKNNLSLKLMYHGTIAKRNGLHIAIEAIQSLKFKIPDIEFHVFGEGDFVDEFLYLVDKLALKNIVYFHGLILHKDIPNEIEAVDIGIIPNERNSFTELNLPTRIFEYISKNKPVIVPRTKGIMDYFNDKSIFFFEAGNKASLEKTIFKAYINKEEREKKIREGNLVYQKYTWKKQKKNLINCIYQLLT